MCLKFEISFFFYAHKDKSASENINQIGLYNIGQFWSPFYGQSGNLSHWVEKEAHCSAKTNN